MYTFPCPNSRSAFCKSIYCHHVCAPDIGGSPSFHQKQESKYYQKLSETEKEIVREAATGDKQHLR